MKDWSQKQIEEALGILKKRSERSEMNQSDVTQENAIRFLNELKTFAEIMIDLYVQDRSQNPLIQK